MNEDIENKILLRSTGETTSKERLTLKEIIKDDLEAAGFARFIDGVLPAGAEAPMDFAAEAIRKVHSKAYIFRVILPAGLAAAAVVFFVVNRSAPVETPIAVERITVAISDRIDTVESEISTISQRHAQGRYYRTAQ
jgi:hypothetical protein